jgi:hypothetical protein
MKRVFANIITPSWVIPGTYLENLRFLEDKKEVSGVELLFFFYDEGVLGELLPQLPEISAYRNRFVMSAHLPDALSEEHSVLVEALLPLVRHFIAHPVSEGSLQDEAALLSRWARRYGGEKFVVENVRLARFRELIALLPPDTGLCMDTGHLLLEGASPAAFAQRYGERIREVHLHDTGPPRAGRLPDHRALRAQSAWLSALRPFLETFTGLINLEVFSWEDIQNSLEVLHGSNQ